MADDFVQVAPDSTGKKIDNTTETTGAGTVERQRVSIAAVGGNNQLAIDSSGRITVNAGTGPATAWKVDLSSTGANATAIKVDGSAVVQPVSGTVTTTPPTNASTNVTQFGSNAVVTGTGASGTGIPRVTVANDSNILATQSGAWSVTANAGTNLNTSALLLDATFTGRINTLGQKAMAASTPVVLASDQSAIPASQSGTWNIGTVTTLTSITNVVHVDDNAGSLTVDNAGTFAVQAAQTGTWNENIAKFGGTNVVIGQALMGSSMPVTIASDQAVIPVTQGGNWITDVTDRAARLLGVVSGTTAENLPATANPILIAGNDNGGTIRSVLTDISGAVLVIHRYDIFQEILEELRRTTHGLSIMTGEDLAEFEY